ncbi:MAG: HNH endonuclease [Candidatus Eisenbacteria bacterium]
MKTYSLFHLADHVLLHDLKAIVARANATTADMLAHIAEVDERRLYLPAAYPSMYLYCVGELHMSEDSALKRIQAARAARRFPGIFDAVAEGRLHLSAVVLLAPRLSADTAGTAEGLLAAAAHKTKAEIALLLAERYPRPDVPTSVRDVATANPPAPQSVDAFATQHAPGHVRSAPRPTVAPLSPGRFDVRLTLDQATHDLLRYAQSLLGHAVPSGDIAEVVKRGLETLVEKLECRVFAASARPRAQSHHGAATGRHVPAEARRTVWRRDGGRCTYESGTGQRCPACTRLEFDHVQPMARGGETTTENLRLRCRAHNQYTAERAFGAGFMASKRQESREKTARSRTAREESAAAGVGAAVSAATRIEPAPGHVDQRERRDEVIPYLRKLGFRVDEAKRGAAMCDGMPDASLEDRVRFAISGLSRERFRRATPMTSTPGTD